MLTAAGWGIGDRRRPPPLIRITANRTPIRQASFDRLADSAVEVDLDLWPLVAPLVPLLEELERIEAMAAGSVEPERPADPGEDP